MIAYLNDFGYIEAKEIYRKWLEWKVYETKLLESLYD